MLANDPLPTTVAGVAVASVTLSLARRADRFPDRTAVVDVSEERLYAPAETVHEDRVSYGELSAIAGRTAGRLASLGIGAGDTVCFVSRNRVASLAVLFACRRLGATYAPICHWLTPATVTRPFEALDPDLVVSEAAQRDLVRSIPFDRSVTLEELAAEEGASIEPSDGVDGGSESGDADDDPDTPLLALHGESGRPVAGFSARAVEWNCITAAVTWGLSAVDSTIVCTPLSTVDGLFRVALPLLYAGGTVLLDRAFDPGDALTAIADHGVTTLACRSTAIRELAASDGVAAVDGLDRVLCDAATPAEALAPYLDRGVPIARAYGRLECPVALSGSIDPDRDDGGSVDDVDVGRPVLDCRARLVDADGTVLEGAVEGRLQLSGPVLADGYATTAGTDDDWFDPAAAATAESAAESDPDRGRFTDGWFDTGETVRRDEDGRYHR
ncbi:AMP-binding protein [Halosolutus amylolyticus]|uniref:AMP-binding protein n=1 Tax=Halosolutus amylolyticus TaxID=2932267 RepID=A0ABD5PJH9_9EURY|nr:AMP-binding protein [Halosolutus amylolyticus]